MNKKTIDNEKYVYSIIKEFGISKKYIDMLLKDLSFLERCRYINGLAKYFKNRVRIFHREFIHKFKCSECGSVKNLEIHHKKYFKNVDNIVVLCKKCHWKHH